MLARKFVVGMVLCALAVTFAGTREASAVTIEDPYWKVSETVSYLEGDLQSSEYYATVDLRIENMHATKSIVGFLVGVPDPVNGGDAHGPVVSSPFGTWRAEWIDCTYGTEIWDSWDGWTALRSDETLADHFGMSWETAVGDYTKAVVYWLNTGSGIGPGEIAADDSDDAAYFYYSIYYGMPASPAAVLLDDGTSYTGPTETENPFQGQDGVIPEPATLSLLGLGLVAGLARKRRKR